MKTKWVILMVLVICSGGIVWYEYFREKQNVVEIDGVGRTSDQTSLSLVFCDFSNSVDSISIREIINDALLVFDSLSEKSKIYFYNVDTFAFAEPFFYFQPLGKLYTPTEREQYKIIKTKGKDSLNGLLKKIAVKPRVRKSCIINCIGQAFRDFSNYDTSGNISLKLIFLSDMIEYCQSPFGFINLEDQEYESDLKLIEKYTDSTVSFKHFRNLDVYINISTRKVKDAKAHDEFWDSLFRKLGYNDLPYLSASVRRFD